MDDTNIGVSGTSGTPPQTAAAPTATGTYGNAAYYSAVPKEKTVFVKIEEIFSFTSLVLGFLFIRFVLCKQTGFVTTGVFIAFAAAFISFMKGSDFKFTIHSQLTAVLMLLFSLTYSITANSFIKTLNTFFLIALILFLTYQLKEENQRIPQFLPIVLFHSLFKPLEHFSKMPQAIGSCLKKSKSGNTIGFIVAGIITAIPITAIVANLLISADKGVSDMLDHIFGSMDSAELSEIIFQIILAVPFGCYIFAVMFRAAHRTPDEGLDDNSCEARLAASRKIPIAAACTAVTPICLLYLLFLISQIGYLFSAFSGSLPDGYSFSEYARRGFFELLAIAVINLVVITVIGFLSRPAADGKKSAAVKIYTITISFFTLIIIASALSKMVLYVSEYGLTQLRAYTSWFMVLCSILFVMIIIHEINGRFPLTRCFAAAFVIMFALLAFSRPDYIIVKYNDSMYLSGKLPEYDTAYALTLSDDAIAALLEDFGTDEIIASNSDDMDYTTNRLKSRLTDYDRNVYSRLNISSQSVYDKLRKFDFPRNE